MSKQVIQQALDFVMYCQRNVTLFDYAKKLRSKLEDAIRAELAKPAQPPNKVTATAPETIYLCVSDNEPFISVSMSWCEDDAEVAVKYIRADLAGGTQ